ncbi:glycosyltransferase [candidate division WWE3 bacterium]|nr:glycosyltransferase [candidate division WWE3 bacterium]
MAVQIKLKNLDQSQNIEEIVKNALFDVSKITQVDEFSSVPPITNQKLNIICLSNQQWDYPFLTNKRHIMERMGKLGHNVLFVDPPINTGRLFFRQIVRGQWPFKRLITRTYRQGSVLVYSPLKLIPNDKITTSQQVEKINALAISHFDPNAKTILWIYHVEIHGLPYILENIAHDLLVYDCVDNYTAFPSRSSFYSATVSKEELVEQERMLTQKADLVFASAPGLVSKLKNYRDEVYFTPNVGDYEKFKDIQRVKEKIKQNLDKDLLPKDLATIRRPRIGFTGAVDEYKFDASLVAKIAKDNPNYNFVIIGPFGLKDKEGSKEEIGLAGLDNVHFLGARPYTIIQDYFAGFDAFIIPFQLNDYTVGGCFPVKFHDALAAGLPTIVTDLPAYLPFKDVCYISKSYEEFSKNISLALKEDSLEKISQRVKIASENNWDGKLHKMLEYVYLALK